MCNGYAFNKRIMKNYELFIRIATIIWIVAVQIPCHSLSLSVYQITNMILLPWQKRTDCLSQ